MTSGAHVGLRRPERNAEPGVEMTNGARATVRRAGGVTIGIAIAVALVVFSLVWMAGESHYRSCVTAATAKYPATPVSALNGTATGPLKVSFVAERQKAVNACSRF